MKRFFLPFISCLFLSQTVIAKSVNVYNWALIITPEIIQQFEKETGIKVNYDVYDTPEIMETKLLAGQSGYDVIGVTVWPYLARQLEINLYQPLDLSLIPNHKGLDPDLLNRMKKIDPENSYALPYVWGTHGFAYNKKMILERYPEAPLESWSLLFDPKVVSKFSDCGVMLIDSPVDVFPDVLNYLNKNPNSDSLVDLKLAGETLSKVRPYIRKFQPVPTVRDITSGDYCLVQGFSGELSLAESLAKKRGLEIQYVIPKEGTAMWIDAFAILRGAPNVKEAHTFINFILRPDVIAKMTNTFETANSVPASVNFVKERIRNNPLIYPSKEVLKKLYTDTNHPPRYERYRLREWTRVKTGL